MKKLLLLIGIMLLAACSSEDVLEITGGKIQGVETEIPGIYVFRGIPYAAPPVGELRWKEPQPVVPWEGVLVADTFGPAAPQTDKVSGTSGRGIDYVKEFYAAGDPLRSEDCLYLNVWTPAPGKTGERLPVALWIHGGAYMQGFGHEIEFDGMEYAKRGVILVTINYRLGLFGYLAHPLLTQESPYNSSGNYGLLDQIAALDWVIANIEQFGGDPHNITVFGQSAGAGSVQAMVTSPLSRDKMQRAIIQSGGGLSGLSTTPFLPQMEQMGQELFANTDINTLEQMRAMTFEELQELFTGWMIKNKRFMMLRPNIDQYVLVEEFSKAAMQGGIAEIPFMIGGCKDDMSPVMTGQSLYDLSIALEYRGRRPAYIYRFDRELPGDDNGAFHSAELWYVFGTLHRAWRPFTAEDRALSHRMINYWTNFMKSGDPNSEGLPRWDPYTSANPAEMRFHLQDDAPLE